MNKEKLNDQINYYENKGLRGVNIKNGFNISSDIMKIISDKNIHSFDSQINQEILNITEEHSKKAGEVISLNYTIEENTTTGNPYHLEAYFMDSGEFPVMKGLEKYRTVILETIFGYKVEMSVIGESHCLKITNNDGKIIASEIVACLPLHDQEHIYKLGDNKAIKYKQKGYHHKIMNISTKYLGKKMGTYYHNGKDIFLSIQEDVLKYGQPQCSYDFPFEIEQEHQGVKHKIHTAGITAIKAFSIENKNEKKIITYSMHGYKKKGGMVYWDAPSEDRIIITKSIFDLNELGKKI